MGFFGNLIGNAIKSNAGGLASKLAGMGAEKLGLGTGATQAIKDIAGGLGNRAGGALGDAAINKIAFRKGGVIIMRKMRRARAKSAKGSIAAKRKMAAVRRFKKRR